MASDLPPIDTTDEVEKYEAHTEQKELVSAKCSHKRAEYRNGEVRCYCGAAWSGERIHELLKILQN